MNVERYLDAWRERARRDRRARTDAERRARAAVPQAVAILRGHGAQRIWLIGSLPRGTFGVDSDLDFLTEGLPDTSAARAAADAADATGFAVDVVRAEALDPEWRAYQQRYGERLDG